MASPQCENGYARIANEILEALSKIRIPGTAWQVLNAIFRKSYGYCKKTAIFKSGEISKMTGLRRQHVQRDIDRLVSMGIVIVTNTGYVPNIGYAIEISFCKDYTKWIAYPNKVTHKTYPNKVTHVTDIGYIKDSLPLTCPIMCGTVGAL